MKRIISIVLCLVLVFGVVGTVFADTNKGIKRNEVVVDENGNKLVLERVLTDIFSEATLKDSKGTILFSYRYDLESGSLYDKINKTTIHNIVEKGETSHNQIDLYRLKASIEYGKGETVKGSLKVASIGAFALGTAIAALVPGAGWAIIIEIANYAVSMGIANCYYTLKVYMATDGQYDYVKRELSIFSDSKRKNQIGKTMSGEQKKAIK